MESITRHPCFPAGPHQNSRMVPLLFSLEHIQTRHSPWNSTSTSSSSWFIGTDILMKEEKRNLVSYLLFFFFFLAHLDAHRTSRVSQRKSCSTATAMSGLDFTPLKKTPNTQQSSSLLVMQLLPKCKLTHCINKCLMNNKMAAVNIYTH